MLMRMSESKRKKSAEDIYVELSLMFEGALTRCLGHHIEVRDSHSHIKTGARKATTLLRSQGPREMLFRDVVHPLEACSHVCMDRDKDASMDRGNRGIRCSGA